MSAKYVLVDTFNKVIISRHRTIDTAAKGKKKFFRQFYRNNSSSSYIPVALMIEDKTNGILSQANDEEEERFDRQCLD